MNRFKLALAITLCLSPLSWSPLSATAQVVGSQVSTTRRQVKFIQQPSSVDLSRRGAPDSGRRVSGGSRGCVGGNKLTALVPLTKNSQGKEYVFGTTAAEYPTFWFYIGYELATEMRITFVLTDDQSHEIYQATALISKNTTPGIFSLRPTEVPLKVGKMYQWYFYVDCHPTDSSEPFSFVNGWVERVSLEETPYSDGVPPLTGTGIEQAVVYGREGVWYDALTIVGEQLQANPQDARIQAEWTGLLLDIGLEAIPLEPLEALKLEKEDLQPIAY